ncbi:MAG: hypothetical protein ACO29M_04925 [Fluviibacter sp.]
MSEPLVKHHPIDMLKTFADHIINTVMRKSDVEGAAILNYIISHFLRGLDGLVVIFV